MRRLALGLIMLLSLGACVRTESPPPAASTPIFQPEIWFKGRMHSTATLKVVTRPPRNLHVDSVGQAEPGGALRLDQAIHWSGGAVERRFWLMRRKSGGGYVVSLSDARGPVSFDTQGARAHLHYQDRRSPIPLIVEQWMDLQPDGLTLANRGVISLFGVPVGRLDETIVHSPS